MRRIQKKQEPVELAQSRLDGRSYKNLDRDTKGAMQKYLCVEQYYLCCFCESRIMPTGQAMRIAHFVPRSVASERQLEWTNLLGSCHGNALTESSSQSPTVDNRGLHCDARQRDRELDPRLDPGGLADGIVFFRPDGKIDSHDLIIQENLQSILNLNHPRLVRARLARLDELIDAVENPNIQAVTLIKPVPDSQGYLDEYFTFLSSVI